MPSEKLYEQQLLIEASPADVFDALTNPLKTRLYMYNCEPVCDWEVASPLLWKGALDDVVYVKGHLLVYEPDKELTYTVFDPNSTIEDIPENYLTTQIILEEVEGATLVKVSQGDFEKVANGQERFKHADGGWNMVLNGLKELVETELSPS